MLGFRVWDNLKKTFDWPFNFYMNELGELEYVDDGYSGPYPFGELLKKRFIPMQSTGIKDDSGKTIYEGDFLTVFLRERRPPGEVKIERNHKSILVKDVKDFLGHAPNFYWPHETVMKIIGNKYQNANLLEDLK